MAATRGAVTSAFDQHMPEISKSIGEAVRQQLNSGATLAPPAPAPKVLTAPSGICANATGSEGAALGRVGRVAPLLRLLFGPYSASLPHPPPPQSFVFARVADDGAPGAPGGPHKARQSRGLEERPEGLLHRLRCSGMPGVWATSAASI